VTLGWKPKWKHAPCRLNSFERTLIG
jgi:hypothetical protein